MYLVLVGIVGEATGSEFIKDVGEGVNSASKFTGDSVGQAADGVWNTASGMIQNDSKKIDSGTGDLSDSVGRTAKGNGTTIKNTAQDGYDTYNGFKARDTERAKES